MKKITVSEGPLFLQSGYVCLNNAQAEPRLHCLRQYRDDWYEITAQVCFKVGEQIGYTENADEISEKKEAEPVNERKPKKKSTKGRKKRKKA